MSLEIVPAGTRFQGVALRMLQASGGPAVSNEHTEFLPSDPGPTGVSLEDLLVALVDGAPAGAILAVRRAGGMAFLWPPAISRAGALDVAGELLRSVAVRLDAAGIQFAQCLLDPADVAGRTALDTAGFPYCTEMLQLVRATRRQVRDASGDETCGRLRNPGLSAIAYDDSRHPVFVRVIEQTFEGSLDCPVLARRRRGEETLAAHRGTGTFEPRLWQVFRREETDVAVLLAVDHVDRAAREIAYLGVVPAARRQGIGRNILCGAIGSARRDGCETVEVAVDAGNPPALALYAGLGFSERRRMAVHLRLGSADTATASGER